MTPGMDGDGGSGLLLGDERPLHGPSLRLRPWPGAADFADDSRAYTADPDAVEDIGNDVASNFVNSLFAQLGRKERIHVTATAHHDVDVRALGDFTESLRVAMKSVIGQFDNRAPPVVAEPVHFPDRDVLIQDTTVAQMMYAPVVIDLPDIFQSDLDFRATGGCKLRRGHIAKQVFVHQCRTEPVRFDRAPDGLHFTLQLVPIHLASPKPFPQIRTLGAVYQLRFSGEVVSFGV